MRVVEGDDEGMLITLGGRVGDRGCTGRFCRIVCGLIIGPNWANFGDEMHLVGVEFWLNTVGDLCSVLNWAVVFYKKNVFVTEEVFYYRK